MLISFYDIQITKLKDQTVRFHFFSINYGEHDEPL
jgi:hypothetical protein